ncbi:MAG: hypothetical protein KDA92_14385 [Planctomycetales bacterium]|nr:hypothetical protein [Planctomycetales bacterium]
MKTFQLMSWVSRAFCVGVLLAGISGCGGGSETATPPASSSANPDEPPGLAELSAEDHQLALAQAICPVSKAKLGSMGAPPKVDVDGREVFICCEGCREELLKDPAGYLANLQAE